VRQILARHIVGCILEPTIARTRGREADATDRGGRRKVAVRLVYRPRLAGSREAGAQLAGSFSSGVHECSPGRGPRTRPHLQLGRSASKPRNVTWIPVTLCCALQPTALCRKRFTSVRAATVALYHSPQWQRGAGQEKTARHGEISRSSRGVPWNMPSGGTVLVVQASNMLMCLCMLSPNTY